MIGGFGGAIVIEEDHRHLVNHHIDAINDFTHAGATSYTVNAVHTQVVAGTNYFFHLTDNHGQHWSVFVNVSLPHSGVATKVLWAEKGHSHARHPL